MFRLPGVHGGHRGAIRHILVRANHGLHTSAVGGAFLGDDVHGEESVAGHRGRGGIGTGRQTRQEGMNRSGAGSKNQGARTRACFPGKTQGVSLSTSSIIF